MHHAEESQVADELRTIATLGVPDARGQAGATWVIDEYARPEAVGMTDDRASVGRHIREDGSRISPPPADDQGRWQRVAKVAVTAAIAGTSLVHAKRRGKQQGTSSGRRGRADADDRP